jgi:hypothetical protein
MWWCFEHCEGTPFFRILILNFRTFIFLNTNISSLFCTVLKHCVSTSGNADKLIEMLLSIPEHLANVHHFPGNKFYQVKAGCTA